MFLYLPWKHEWLNAMRNEIAVTCKIYTAEDYVVTDLGKPKGEICINMHK